MYYIHKYTTYISDFNKSIVSPDGADVFQGHAVTELVAEPLTIVVDQKSITLSHDSHMNILVWEIEIVKLTALQE